MDLQRFLLSLITIYVGARVMGELAARVGQSAVLGELLAGVLLGGSVLGWAERTETLSLLGEVGVMLLLFDVGLESERMPHHRGPDAGVAARRNCGVVAHRAARRGLRRLARVGPDRAPSAYRG